MDWLSNKAGLLSAGLLMSALLVGCAHDGAVDEAQEDGDAEYAGQWVTESQPISDNGQCGVRIPPSLNCGDKLAPGDERQCRLGGRSYTIRAGKTMDPCKPAAVVIDVPASVETPQVHMGRQPFCLGLLCWNGIGSGWVAESDTPDGGFIVIVPHRNTVVGTLTALTGGTREDPSFIRQLAMEVRRVANVDPDRIYISGAWDGADTAQDAACTHPDIFKGVSPNSGSFACRNLGRPLPYIAFAARGSLRYTTDLIATEAVARANRCQRGPSAWRTFDGRTNDAVCRSTPNDPNARLVPCSQLRNNVQPTTCRVWDRCDGNVEVVFCEVPPNTDHGMLNAASDSLIVYNNSTQLNTPSVAWRFFQQF